jgi:hypothetical protein
MHRRDPIDAIVIPAVGTGAGKLSKAGFYNKLLSDVLVKELSKPYDLPTPIYLLVQRNEAGNRWHETRIAMAGAVAAAVATWDFDTDHRSPDSEWVSLTGVAMGSCIILVALAFGARIGIAADLVPLTSHPKPLIFVAWISAAVGLVSMFKALLAFFPAHLSPYLHLIAGVLTAFICGPLIRANSAFDETVKFRKAASKSVATQPVDSNPNE